MLPDLAPSHHLSRSRGARVAILRRWLAWAGWMLSLGLPFGLAAQGMFYAKNVDAPIYGTDGELLFKAVGRVEVLYKDTVLNTSKNTMAASGIFAFGILSIPDVGVGSTASITVRAWDSSVGYSYEKAQSAGYGYGQSTFNVVLGTATKPGVMTNFTGFCLSKEGVFFGAFFGTGENSAQVFNLDSLGWVACCATNLLGQPASVLTNLYPDTIRQGTLSGTLPNPVYQPKPNIYGGDFLTYPIVGSQILPCPDLYPIYIYIQPSPERSGPALVAESSAGKTVPKLRGLADHHYRVEKSADLMAWEAAGEVVGNYSEVDLSPFLAPNARAQFFRATDITPP